MRPSSSLFSLFLLLTCSFLSTGCPSQDTGSEPEPDPGSMVLLPVEGDPSVSFKVSFRVGSQNDPEGKEGLARLTATLLAEGSTTEHSYEEILDLLYPMASSYDVRVDKELTTFSGRTHSDNLEPFFGLLTDAYLRPAFRPEDFERAKNKHLNELRNTLRYSSDEELGKAALIELIFGGTGYRHPIDGTIEGLESITLEDVRDFYATHYVRGNVTLGLGGGFPVDLPQRFADSLELLGEGSGLPVAPPEPDMPDHHRVLLVSKPGADASISFGFPIDVRRGEREFYALWIANSWLGEHRNSSSHLYQVIREARGMNYGDYSYIEAFPNGGRRQMPPTNVVRQKQIFEVWIRTLPNEQAHFALRAAVRELDQLVENGMSEAEFKLTRSFLSKYRLHFASTTLDRLGYAVDDYHYGIESPGHLARFGEMMRSITREEVNAAVRKHLGGQKLQIAIVTGEAERLRKALAEDSPSPMQYASEKSPELLAEDKEIAAYPLEIDAETIAVVEVSQIFEQ